MKRKERMSMLKELERGKDGSSGNPELAELKNVILEDRKKREEDEQRRKEEEKEHQHKEEMKAIQDASQKQIDKLKGMIGKGTRLRPTIRSSHSSRV